MTAAPVPDAPRLPDAAPLGKEPHPMDTLSPRVPPRCQGCTDLEKRVAEMERFFAILQGSVPRPPSARQRAAERWQEPA